MPNYAEELEECQTPEWAEHFIDYRGVCKRIDLAMSAVHAAMLQVSKEHSVVHDRLFSETEDVTTFPETEAETISLNIIDRESVRLHHLVKTSSDPTLHRTEENVTLKLESIDINKLPEYQDLALYLMKEIAKAEGGNPDFFDHLMRIFSL